MPTHAKDRLSPEALTGRGEITGPVDNANFLPGVDAGPARHRFCGRLLVAETEMRLHPAAMAEQRYLGKRIDLFPACELAFVSAGDDLIPLERDIQRPRGGTSYWDIILSPGRVWSEPGSAGRSLGAFPFVLSNARENDAHNGLAVFLFDAASVSALRVQVVQETATYLLSGGFDAWGLAEAELRALVPSEAAAPVADFAREVGEQLPVRPWGDLASRCDPALLAALAEDSCAATTIVQALVVDGEIYATPSRARYGDYPYARHMRHGSWSMAKSAAAAVAALRLGQLYGDEVLAARVTDLLEVTAAHDGWADVTLGDCLNMATGIGDAGPTPAPPDIHADNLTDPAVDAAGAARYRAWYDAPSAAAKLAACFSCGNYPWGPGEVARYRDPDIFLAGALMDAYLKRREGPDADLWDRLRQEVFGPIGIRHLPMNRTLEADGAAGLALMAFGLFLTLDDGAKLARLLHDGGRLGGRAGGRQLLSPRLLAQAIDPDRAKGLPTGEVAPDGPVTYHMAFWHYPYQARSGRLYHIPTMRGFGGNMLQILPNGMTALRFAHDSDAAEKPYDPLAYTRIADDLRPL